MKIKIRLQGTQEEVAFLKNYLLKKHPGLCLGSPREGTNPKYAGNQKWSSYGDIEFTLEADSRGKLLGLPIKTFQEKKRRRRK